MVSIFFGGFRLWELATGPHLVSRCQRQLVLSRTESVIGTVYIYMYNVVINSLYDYFFSVIQPQLKHAIFQYWESITSPVPKISTGRGAGRLLQRDHFVESSAGGDRWIAEKHPSGD